MAIEKGKEWLLYMQNDDGGWGTFERFDGDKDFKDPTESTEDPSVADITGHVLTALASCGYTSNDQVIQKCIDYIKKDQNDQGATCTVPLVFCKGYQILDMIWMMSLS